MTAEERGALVERLRFWADGFGREATSPIVGKLAADLKLAADELEASGPCLTPEQAQMLKVHG